MYLNLGTAGTGISLFLKNEFIVTYGSIIQCDFLKKN
eukprot:SAG31_NODE_955_length_10799_cov_6.576636_7_plen_37_part_00